MAPGYDLLFNSLTALLIFCLVLIMGAMVYFVWKYRYRGGAHMAVEISHNTALEVAWSVIPLFVVIGLFAWGFKNYLDMVIPPKDAIEIRVTGQKWSWSFEYENGATSGNEIAVPINKPVKLIMTSNDVLHAFFIPSFRVKMDVVPKKFNVLWFQATQYGPQQVLLGCDLRVELCADPVRPPGTGSPGAEATPSEPVQFSRIDRVILERNQGMSMQIQQDRPLLGPDCRDEQIGRLTGDGRGGPACGMSAIDHRRNTLIRSTGNADWAKTIHATASGGSRAGWRRHACHCAHRHPFQTCSHTPGI